MILIWSLLGCTQRSVQVGFLHSILRDVQVDIQSPVGTETQLADIPFVVTFSEDIPDIRKIALSTSGGIAVLESDQSYTGKVFKYTFRGTVSANQTTQATIAVIPQDIVVVSQAETWTTKGSSIRIVIDREPPAISFSLPSPMSGSRHAVFEWDIFYVGASQITISNNDLELLGDHEGCRISVLSSDDRSAKIRISECRNVLGAVRFGIRAGTAHDRAGNVAASAEAPSSVFINNGNIEDPQLFPDLFITNWDTSLTSATSNSENTIVLPLVQGHVYDFFVDWGDGTPIQRIQTSFATNGIATHNYSTSGRQYTVRMLGKFPHLAFKERPNDTGISWDSSKLKSVERWGSNQWATLEGMFRGCENLTHVSGVDAPDLSRATSLAYMFRDAVKFNSDITAWDVSNIVFFHYMFSGTMEFNQSIGSWTTTNMQYTHYMFQNAVSFNRDLHNWNTSRVENMSSMFNGASRFNGNISTWDTSNVTNMSAMFAGATLFNQEIGGWSTARVMDMSNMFNAATAFNRPLSSWNTISVTNMSSMFYNAHSFNQNLANFNTLNVTNMSSMFEGAIVFNSNIASWLTGSVTNMNRMFLGAQVFNQNLSGWNISSVERAGTGLWLGRPEQFSLNAYQWSEQNQPNWLLVL